MKSSILNIVLKYCDITKEQFFSKSRHPEIVRAKMMAVALMIEIYHAAINELARYLKTDHSNIIHYKDRHADRLIDKYYKQDYEQIKRLVEIRRFNQLGLSGTLPKGGI